MRVVVTERTIGISSNAQSAGIGLGGMTASAIAVHTDATKNRKPLVDLAFDPISRYRHGGLLRKRFISRLTAADLERYADRNGGIAPHRVWGVVMQDEKPAGHDKRCGAVGLIDVAIWDLAAKACGEPLWRTFARDGLPHASGRIAIYASGGHCRSENDIALSCDEVRRATDRGHCRFKIKIGGAKVVQHLRRIGALLTILEPGMMLAHDACN